MKHFKKAYVLLIWILILGCKQDQPAKEMQIEVSQEQLTKHIEILASDDFMGRMPFTEGETKTLNYLETTFKELGLSPGNGISYFQDVPMVEINGTVSEVMTIKGTGEEIPLNYFEDFMATTKKPKAQVGLDNSELVFAGYGIVAPEYGWNDYEGIDWKGKTAVVLVNDPGFQSGDATLFKGDEMTYYGRWTYKYEEAARQGAAGVLIIHQTLPAAYGWNVVQSGWIGAQLNLETNAPLINAEGWITEAVAQRLLTEAKIPIDDIRSLARTKDFKPMPLGLTASINISNTIKRDVSKNVVAVLPGTDLKDEYIIYSAHWDHLGIGKSINNDSIYNGASDNATGTASLLAIAEAFKKGKPNRRSVVFLAVTAEEQGLLGSAYYAEHPIYSPQKTVANINMDGILGPGKMKDLTITGYGHSEMDNYAEIAAEKQGRYIIPDPEAEKGYFFRSDHFNFAKIGIPALYAKGKNDHFEKGKEFAERFNKEYRKNRYHQPSDEFDPKTSNVSGAQLDAQLFYSVGLQLANEAYFPKWNEGSEFKAFRED